MRKLILESIRTWIVSCQSSKVMVDLELRWSDSDARFIFPAFEEFLAIIFFERRRNIRVAHSIEAHSLTADERILLDAFAVARSDEEAAARSLGGLLGDASARAAARAAAKVGGGS